MARTITYKNKQERRIVIASAVNIMKGAPEKFQKMLIDGYPYGKIDKNYGEADWKTKSQAHINEQLIARSTLIHPSSRHFEWPLADISDRVYGVEQPDIFRSGLLVEALIECAYLYRIQAETSKKGASPEMEKQFKIGINNLARIAPMAENAIDANDTLVCCLVDMKKLIEVIEDIPSSKNMPVSNSKKIREVAEKAADLWAMFKERVMEDDFDEPGVFSLISIYSMAVGSLRKSFLKEVIGYNNNEDTLIIHEQGIF